MRLPSTHRSGAEARRAKEMMQISFRNRFLRAARGKLVNVPVYLKVKISIITYLVEKQIESLAFYMFIMERRDDIDRVFSIHRNATILCASFLKHSWPNKAQQGRNEYATATSGLSLVSLSTYGMINQMFFAI